MREPFENIEYTAEQLDLAKEVNKAISEYIWCLSAEQKTALTDEELEEMAWQKAAELGADNPDKIVQLYEELCYEESQLNMQQFKEEQREMYENGWTDPDSTRMHTANSIMGQCVDSEKTAYWE